MITDHDEMPATRVDWYYDVVTDSTDLAYDAWLAERLGSTTLPAPRPIPLPPPILLRTPPVAAARHHAVTTAGTVTSSAPAAAGGTHERGLAPRDRSRISRWHPLAHVGMFFALGPFWLIAVAVDAHRARRDAPVAGLN